MNRKNYFLVLLALSLCACGKRSSGPQTDTTDTRIVFDWSQKSEEDAVPAGMTLLFYPSNGGAMIQQDVSADPPGISLPVGDYRVIAVSNDSETTKLRGESVYETAELYLSGTDTRANEVLPKIDRAQYATVKESSLSVKTGGVDNTFQLLLQPIVKKIKFEVLVDLDKQVQACSGVLTGISSSVRLGTLEPSRENPSRVRVDFVVSLTEVLGETLVFGACPDVEGTERVPNKLLLDLLFTDGSATVVPIDVSEAMNETLEDKISVSIKLQMNNDLELIGKLVGWQVGEEVRVPVEQ